jgi:CheY-like chemotaxis protein
MKKSMQILLVEDNLSDVLLTKKVLENLETPLQLNVVGDGDEAMAYL